MRPLATHPLFSRIAAPVGLGLFVLLAWQLFCKQRGIPVYLFPAPSDIALKLAGSWPELFGALLSTLAVTCEAFVLAIVLGTMTAFLFVQSRLIAISLYPFAVLLQVTPIVAIAPLIIILVKNTQVALTICATVIAIFPIISNTTIGLSTVDPGLLAYFRMNKASRLQTLIRLRIPCALPYFLAGLRISSGLALIGAVVAEFVAGTGGPGAGLAYDILQSGMQLDIPRMFAALVLIALTGILLFVSMAGLSQLLLGHWHESSMGHEK
ncbi:ABC transporter permease [Telmatospirillum siberiense]|uniref:ABC transporter ATP-binding protein n=1 Tax=Telmatospirillum siberiense TaxID=382514 RepID=A0A2N3PVP9_9PROT|nr:ABC transporter permease [Telmatospirillum siberiense]PKU24479.1 ABC transporter ATP-binding protein [Telmatospirillum siberiense]